jgi:hypothetical protein
MAADVLKYAIGNSSSTTSSSAVNNTDGFVPIDADANFQAKSGEGMVLMDEGEANEELAYATEISDSILTVPLANRGLENGTPQAHILGSTVKGVLTAGMWNSVIDALTNVVLKTTGYLDTTKVVDLTSNQTLTNKTLTSPVINNPTLTATNAALTTPSISSPTITGTPVLDADSAIPFYCVKNYLYNGSFNIWQRGTSYTDTGSAWHYYADRWLYCNNSSTNANTGIDRWDVSGAGNFTYGIRLKRNAGATYANSMWLNQALETKDSLKLRGKKLTLSFYVLCGANYTGGDLSVYINTGTGTDEKSSGNFTGVAVAAVRTVTPSTSWVKYTLSTSSAISTSATQVGIVIGTSNFSGTAGADDTLYLTQVQLNEGSIALPYETKTFAEELRICQRYYEKSYDYATAPGTNTTTGAYVMQDAGGASTNGNYVQATVPYKVSKRADGTGYCYDRIGTINKVTLKSADASNTDNIAGTVVVAENAITVYAQTTATTQRGILFSWEVDAELTA